jgi:hypothetical protein
MGVLQPLTLTQIYLIRNCVSILSIPVKTERYQHIVVTVDT